MDDEKIPNLKHQIANNLQNPMTKITNKKWLLVIKG
jgi:hypothetical protein